MSPADEDVFTSTYDALLKIIKTGNIEPTSIVSLMKDLDSNFHMLERMWLLETAEDLRDFLIYVGHTPQKANELSSFCREVALIELKSNSIIPTGYPKLEVVFIAISKGLGKWGVSVGLTIKVEGEKPTETYLRDPYITYATYNRKTLMALIDNQP